MALRYDKISFEAIQLKRPRKVVGLALAEGEPDAEPLAPDRRENDLLPAMSLRELFLGIGNCRGVDTGHESAPCHEVRSL